MTLGEQIRTARIKQGLTQRVVSNRTGLSILTINVVENDRFRGKGKYPDLDTVIKLVAELRVPLEFSERGRKIVLSYVKTPRKTDE